MSRSPEHAGTAHPASSAQDEEGDEDVVDEVEIEGDDEESLINLREISPLASWTVSTYKPGCGVAALLNPSTEHFWQSDGPQPHLLNIHFFKLVTIVRLRVYLDLEMDESYTPTRIIFLAGHSEYDVVEFAEWRAPNTEEGPRGWEDISLENSNAQSPDEEMEEEHPAAGSLRCMFLQVRVMENHQNGKDTHIRGVQVWARDERMGRVGKSKQFEYAGMTSSQKSNIASAFEGLDLYPEDDFGEGEIR